MLGTKSEFVSDSYDPNYYRVSPKQDPQGPAIKPNTRAVNVSRGGNGSGDNEARAHRFIVKRTKAEFENRGLCSLRLVLEFIEDDDKKE